MKGDTSFFYGVIELIQCRQLLANCFDDLDFIDFNFCFIFFEHFPCSSFCNFKLSLINERSCALLVF